VGDLHELTALEQADALRRGEVGAVELVAHYLDRIGAYGAEVGAFVTVTAEPALAQAREAQAALSAGALPTGGELPALFGVPTAIKDLVPTAGVRTTFGSAAFAEFVPRIDADVVALLRAAGTISLGKTTTSEFGLSCHAESEVAPPARNPWAPEFTAGGSSGGAGAAVAAGLLPVAHGTDGGGSVRIPAAICGLVGYKPSRGLVSGGPVGFGAFGLPTSGALGRTVADVAALVDAFAGAQLGEPYPAPPRVDLLAAARRRPERGLRIGRFTEPVLAEASVDPACVAAVDTAARLLTAAGHEIVELPGLLDSALRERFDTLWAALAVQSSVPADREPLLQPLTGWMMARGRLVPVPELLGVLGLIQDAVRRSLRGLAGIDLLLCPTLAAPQARIGYFTETGDPAEDFARQKSFSPFCAAFNVTGQPAVSLPLHRTGDGLPVGAMLAAGVGEDGLLLSVAAAIEEAAPWRRMAGWPPLP
jgi:amidase